MHDGCRPQPSRSRTGAALAALLAACIALTRAPAAHAQPGYPATISVGSPVRVFSPNADCLSLWNTVGLRLAQSLPIYYTGSYTCSVPTGNSLPSIVTLNVYFNDTQALVYSYMMVAYSYTLQVRRSLRWLLRAAANVAHRGPLTPACARAPATLHRWNPGAVAPGPAALARRTS